MTALTNLISRLEQAEQGATRGPWKKEVGLHPKTYHSEELNFAVSAGDSVSISHHYIVQDPCYERHADFIALSRNALPALLRIVKLQAEAIRLARGYGRFDKSTPEEEVNFARSILRDASDEAERIAGECNG